MLLPFDLVPCVPKNLIIHTYVAVYFGTCGTSIKVFGLDKNHHILLLSNLIHANCITGAAQRLYDYSISTLNPVSKTLDSFTLYHMPLF